MNWRIELGCICGVFGFGLAVTLLARIIQLEKRLKKLEEAPEQKNV